MEHSLHNKHASSGSSTHATEHDAESRLVHVRPGETRWVQISPDESRWDHMSPD